MSKRWKKEEKRFTRAGKLGLIGTLIIFLLISLSNAAFAAEEECVAGAASKDGSKNKWTLYLGNRVFYLEGHICASGKEWKGKDLRGNVVYYNGSYVLKAGFHKSSSSTGKTSVSIDAAIGFPKW